ncbi:2Fe-2S iron-sulfur cluster-binding protein [Cupriavidus sp. P-10]
MDVPLPCEQGVCGTCITQLLDGAPDQGCVLHRR